MEENKSDITQESAAESDVTQIGDMPETTAVSNDTDRIGDALQVQRSEDKSYADEPGEERSVYQKIKGSFWWSIIRLIISLFIIAVGVYVILYIVARAAKYETIYAMLQSMFIELELMWQRVLY